MSAAAEAVEALYGAINGGDRGAMLNALHDDVRWHRPPDVPVTGTVVGAGEVAKMWDSFAGSLRSFEIRPSRLEASGDLVLAPITMRGSGSGGDFEFGGAQVFRLDGARIAEVWEFRSLPEARALIS